MRRAIQNIKPDFSSVESTLENYQFNKDGLQLKTRYTAEDANNEVKEGSAGKAPYLRGP